VRQKIFSLLRILAILGADVMVVTAFISRRQVFDLCHNNCYTFSITKGVKMESIKTAISIDKSLFAQANALARKMKVTRSRLFVLALEDFIHEQENRELLEKINAVFADEPTESEKTLRRKARKSHRRLVEGQW
jgi:predicted transcriptional regulator